MKIKKLFFILLCFFCVNCAAEPLKGAWVATVNNLDWPSKRGLPKKQQQAELIKIFDDLKEAGFNTVILQVRPTADTFWPSQKEPWSFFLTGVQGKNPGYDPLAFAVEQAHKRGLKIHAWFNPFRVQTAVSGKLSENHPAVKNKDWVIKYGDVTVYDPGSPSARRHIIEVITEAAAKYDIDGVHLDDYFYPYPQVKNGKGVVFNDKKSFKKHAAQNQTLADWRRQNINTFIKDLRSSLKSVKPDLEFGISPFAVWCNEDECEEGSATKGFSSYGKIFADTNFWLDEGYLDYVVPQIYWSFGHSQKPFEKVLEWWDNKISSLENPPKLYIGIAAYEHGAKYKEGEIIRQINHAKELSSVDGFIYFRATHVLDDKTGLKKIIETLNKT